MRRQMASLDEAERKRLFDEVQTIFAEHLPMIQFVAPRIFVARLHPRHQPDADGVLAAAAAVVAGHDRRRTVNAVSSSRLAPDRLPARSIDVRRPKRRASHCWSEQLAPAWHWRRSCAARRHIQ